MITYLQLITSLRYELADSEKTEWDDNALFEFVKRAERRVRSLVIKHRLWFLRKTHEFHTVVGTPNYALPVDFDIDDGLFRKDMRKALPLIEPEYWEQMTIPSVVVGWRIDGDELEFIGTPSEVIPMKLYYYPTYVEPINQTVELCCKGRLTDPIFMYAAFIAKNVDEMDLTADTRMLGEIESHLLELYNRNRQTRTRLVGNFI